MSLLTSEFANSCSLSLNSAFLISGVSWNWPSTSDSSFVIDEREEHEEDEELETCEF